jgi:hypothetical protein
MAPSPSSPLASPAFDPGRRDDRRYRMRPGVSTAPAAERALVADLDRGTAYRLNQTARAMWELLAEGRTVAEVASALHERLGASRSQVEADAARLVADLLQEGLLEPRPEAG